LAVRWNNERRWWVAVVTAWVGMVWCEKHTARATVRAFGPDGGPFFMVGLRVWRKRQTYRRTRGESHVLPQNPGGNPHGVSVRASVALDILAVR